MNTVTLTADLVGIPKPQRSDQTLTLTETYEGSKEWRCVLGGTWNDDTIRAFMKVAVLSESVDCGDTEQPNTHWYDKKCGVCPGCTGECAQNCDRCHWKHAGNTDIVTHVPIFLYDRCCNPDGDQYEHNHHPCHKLACCIGRMLLKKNSAFYIASIQHVGPDSIFCGVIQNYIQTPAGVLFQVVLHGTCYIEHTAYPTVPEPWADVVPYTTPFKNCTVQTTVVEGPVDGLYLAVLGISYVSQRHPVI